MRTLRLPRRPVLNIVDFLCDPPTGRVPHWSIWRAA